MDGVHDLGGKQGFGPVRYGAGKAVFKAPWEKRANALYSLGIRLGIMNMDEYRHAIERMEPRHYLAAGYYERSLTGFATLCVERGGGDAGGAGKKGRRSISAVTTERRRATQCDLPGKV